jgi:methyl-accepting chemotaxis protein
MVVLYFLYVSIAIALLYFLLKAWLKKSFLFRLFFVAGLAMIATAMLFYTAGTLGATHVFWAIPVALALNAISYIYGVNHIEKPFRDIIDTLQGMSKGNMKIFIAPAMLERSDEIGELSNVTSDMVQALGEVLQSLKLGVENINKACQQLSVSSQHLSQSANQQAASVEEVSSSMQQMTANIEQNSSNSTETEKIASHAAKQIEENKNAVEVTVQSMNEIAKKINIINDIAFQTNILALNAAVEASHAGIHGRGFAVVAAEVRKLAENSKTAADEIDRLSKSGVTVAQKARTQLDTIVPEIQKTAKLILEISSASMEQRSGSDQINQAVQHLNSITQANASSSEELTSSVEELVAHAEMLLKKLSFFHFSGVSMHTSHKVTQEKSDHHAQTNETHKISRFTKRVTKASEEEPTDSKKGFNLKLRDSHKDDQYESF